MEGSGEGKDGGAMKAEEKAFENEFADLCNCARSDGTHAVDCAAVLVIDSGEDVTEGGGGGLW